jgi:predicted HTH transcriptional regulator
VCQASHALPASFRCLITSSSFFTPVQSANAEISKCQNGTLDCTLEELAVLQAVKANPTITQKELAVAVDKSERTIKRRMTDLQEKGYLRRANGKRNGHWEVLVDLS